MFGLWEGQDIPIQKIRAEKRRKISCCDTVEQIRVNMLRILFQATNI
jgi:hypothetical protein